MRFDRENLARLRGFWQEHPGVPNVLSTAGSFSPPVGSHLSGDGYYLDFRTPRIAAKGGRKRYVMFTKSPRVHQAIALYFAGRALAPSE